MSRPLDEPHLRLKHKEVLEKLERRRAGDELEKREGKEGEGEEGEIEEGEGEEQEGEEGDGEEGEEEEGEGNISPMCKSIGHRPAAQKLKYMKKEFK